MFDQQQIFAPFLGMTILTLVVWVYMYARRIPFILSNQINMDEVSADEFHRLTPAGVRHPSDNLKNLFEIPVLFYAICLYLFVTSQVDTIYLASAWTFFVFRIVHSGIHCLANKVLLRFGIYCISTVAVWFMVVRAAVVFFDR